MKAAVYHGPPGSWPQKPITIEEVPTPVPGLGDVLVKVAACGLCHSDLTFLKGARTAKEPPLILGHEPSGVVASIGAEVKSLKPGQKVIMSCIVPCLSCAACRSGHENQCHHPILIGSNCDGALAEYVVMPESGIYPVPPGLPLEESCIVADIVCTAYHAIYDVAQVRPGDTVAVYGASGGVGLICVQYASAIGARVIGIARKKWKLEKARELGADEIVSTEETERLEQTIREVTGGGADISIDATGVPGIVESAIKGTRTGGKVVEVGMSFNKFNTEIMRLVWCELSIMGSRLFNPTDIPKAFKLIQDGIIKPEKVISHRFKLEEVNQAYQMLDRGELLRGIVVM